MSLAYFTQAVLQCLQVYLLDSHLMLSKSCQVGLGRT